MFEEEKEYQTMSVSNRLRSSGMYKNILTKVQWTDTFMYSGGYRECGDTW